jgi:hypothetical protein
MNYLRVFAVDLGVFEVADHEFDFCFPPRLGIRTRNVEKSVFMNFKNEVFKGFCGRFIGFLSR